MLLLAYIINATLCSSAILVHYFTFTNLSHFINHSKLKPRHKVLICIYASLAAHILEIWVFGIAYYWLLKVDGFGALQGIFNHSLHDCVYFSFSAYTSLGMGDINPTGLLKFTTGLETLTGLVLISWTASFVFFEMQKHWKTN